MGFAVRNPVFFNATSTGTCNPMHHCSMLSENMQVSYIVVSLCFKAGMFDYVVIVTFCIVATTVCREFCTKQHTVNV